MRGAVWACVIGAACGARHEPAALVGASEPAPVAVHAPAAPPSVTFATRTMEEVAIYRLGADHIEVVERAPRLDTRDLEDLAWTGPDQLYVQLDDGAVAAVRDDALVPVLLPPEGAWRTSHDADEVELFPQRSLVTSGHELWQGRCTWGHSDGETSSCDEWAWARIAPAPAIVRPSEPSQTPDLDPPTAPPSRDMTFEIVPDAVADAATGSDAVSPRTMVRCTIGGHTTEFPPAADRGPNASYEGVRGVRWLSDDPPLVTVDEIWPAYDGSSYEPVVFEGCTAVARGGLHVGPGGVLAVIDDGTAWLWWRGRELGKVKADTIVFAPAL